jgi:hypothetical protein
MSVVPFEGELIQSAFIPFGSVDACEQKDKERQFQKLPLAARCLLITKI